MRSPKRLKRVVKYFDDLEKILLYYFPEDRTETKKLKLQIKEIKEFIEELTLDKKISDARLAKKIKEDIEKDC